MIGLQFVREHTIEQDLSSRLHATASAVTSGLLVP